MPKILAASPFDAMDTNAYSARLNKIFDSYIVPINLAFKLSLTMKFLTIVAPLIAFSLHTISAQSVAYEGKFGTQSGTPYTFYIPNSVAVYNSTGEVYVTNQSAKVVSRFNAAGEFIQTIGAPGSGDGQFNFPTGISVDQSNGHIYVGDSNNRRVEEFDHNGVFVRAISTAFQNQYNQTVGYPQNVVVNSTAGLIYVAATGTVRCYAIANGQFQFTFTPMTANSSGQNPIALDQATGDILSVGSTNTIERYNSSGVFLSSFGIAGTGNGQFTQVGLIAADATGNIYVEDFANSTTRIEMFDRNGAFLTAFAPPTDPNANPFSGGGLCVTATNDVFVIDNANAQLLKFHTTFPAPPAPLPAPLSPTVAGKRNVVTTKAKITLKGGATSDVVSVNVKVRKKAYRNAQGTTHWSYRVPLIIGKNIVLVRTTNASGVTSAPVKIRITRKP